MTVESATYIDDLGASNPAGTDQKSEGDDHIRLIKTVLQASIKNSDRAFYIPKAELVTSDNTLVAADENNIQSVSASGGAVDIDLPAVGGIWDGWTVAVIKTDSSANAVTITPASGTINGESSLTLSNQYDFAIVIYDGSGWWALKHSNAASKLYLAAEHNLVVNAFFQVSQENGDTQGSSSAYYATDEWSLRLVSGGSATVTVERDAAPFSSFTEIPYGIKVDCTAGDTINAGDLCTLQTRIEGLRLKGRLNWGAAGGKDLKIGFLYHADYTGVFTVAVRNSAGNRSYVKDVTIVQNTDTWVSLTIPEDTTGTWLETNGVGLILDITLTAGSSWQGTDGTWEAAGDLGTSSTTHFMGTLGNTFWLGPMLVFPEDIDMPADANELHLFMRPYRRDLEDCLPYWRSMGGKGDLIGQVAGAAVVRIGQALVPPMRAAPSATLTDSSPTVAIAGSTATGSGSSIASSDLAADAISIAIDGFSGLTAGQNVISYNTTNLIELDARL